MHASRLMDTVKRHEGFSSTVYTCPAGKATVGYGRNLVDKGLTEREAEWLLVNDLAEAVLAVRDLVPTFVDIDGPRQEALVNMCYNLGPAGLKRFKRMLAAVARQDWAAAADEALDSRWRRQVGRRAEEIAAALRHGRWPEQETGL